MSVNIETAAQVKPIFFVPQEIEMVIPENTNIIIEQIAELLENPLMKKEVINRNNEKINDALNVLNAIYDSSFLNDHPDEEDLQSLMQYLQRANAQLKSGMDTFGNLINDFSLHTIDKELLNELMLETLASMGSRGRTEDEEEEDEHIHDIAPGPVGDSGVSSDIDIIDRLNDFVGDLTDVFLKRYQDAAQETTNIYTAFAELNIAISSMISGADVDAETNTISLDISGLRTAIEDLRKKLFDPESEIVIALAAIQFPATDDGSSLAMAEELAKGAGLVVVGDGPYSLAVDESAFNNVVTAFESLTQESNLEEDDPNRIDIPSGTLQAFQTAIESVNNRVSTENQTLIERLRNVTSQQQQTTQLFSSLMKEIFESNKGFLNKVA